MSRNTLLITTAAAAIALAFAPQAMAQTAPANSAASATDQGILIFTPDFFADQNPNTALDMVQRVPGFSVSDGDGGRGFEGAVGNILINGARPASKNDSGSSVLSRTLVAQVERIELIRGGAPGIDMQGYSVVVNVILKNESSRQTVVSANATLFDGGTDLYGGSYQFTARNGDRTWGFTLSDGISMSDSNGFGPATRRAADGTALREEDYYNDGYGGGTGIRGNFAAPALGGKVDLTARYGVSDWHGYDQFTALGTFRESRSEQDGFSGEVGGVYTRPLGARLSMETRLIHEFSDYDSVSSYNADMGAGPDPEQLFESTNKASESIARGLVRFERSEALTFAVDFLQEEKGFTTSSANLALIVAGLPGIPAMLWAGSASDRWGRRRVGCAFMALMALGALLFFAIPLEGWPVVTFMCLATVGNMGSWPIIGGMASELFPTSLRGQATSFATSSRVLGQALSLALGSYLLHLSNDNFALTTTVLVMGVVVCIVVIFVFFPDTHARELESLAVDDEAPPPGEIAIAVAGDATGPEAAGHLLQRGTDLDDH